MQILKTPIESRINKSAERNPKFKGGREIVRTLANPNALASTIMLESCVTSGRSINAYKRGGFHEARERFFDDFVSAVFWMKGVDIFNKIGDKIGKSLLKLPTTEFDVGKDALRTPFQNLSTELAQNVISADSAKALEKKLALFKFSKVIISTLLATGFVGFALPKINQSITKNLFASKKKDEPVIINNSSKNNLKFNDLHSVSFADFNKSISNRKNQSFKSSAGFMTTLAHSLENNKICKLLASDVGILSGRVLTARNKDEGLEYFFRDSVSAIFYYASTPFIYGLLQKATSNKGITTLDPVAAKQLHENMIVQLKENGGKLNVDDFAKKTIGVLDDAAKSLIEKLPFKSEVISLNELAKHISDENILEKAKEMAKLQPQKAGIGSVLTRQQVMDVLKNGSVNSPKFMQEIFTEKFGNDLTNPYKYIPIKNIQKFRTQIDEYANSVIEIAKKKNNGIVTEELLNKVNKKGYILSAGFRLAGIAVSAFALGVVIPKVQYAITARRTGTTSAPGLRAYQEEK